jgi:hypothetical protein
MLQHAQEPFAQQQLKHHVVMTDRVGPLLFAAGGASL